MVVVDDASALKLTAGLTDIAHEDGIRVVSLASDENYAWQLMFQRADAFDDQDRALGQDTYCIVSGWQEGTIYGGIQALSVDGDRVALQLSPDAARELGLAIHVTIAIARDVELARDIAANLALILGLEASQERWTPA